MSWLNEKFISQFNSQYFQISELSQENRTLQPMLMVMSGSYHPNDTYEFGQFRIFSQNLIINIVSWDMDFFLRDAHFLHVQFLNPQDRKINHRFKFQLLHPSSCKYLIHEVEIKNDLNDCQILQANFSSLSFMKEFKSHTGIDSGQSV